jgi:hypothetical protein
VCKECDDWDGDIEKLGPEQRASVEAHPAIGEHLLNRQGQFKRNGRKFTASPMKMAEAWSRMSKLPGATQEDIDMTANTLSWAMNLNETLNNPAKMMQHVMGKVMHEQGGTLEASAMLIDPISGQIKPLGKFSAPIHPTTIGEKIKAMEKADIDELWNDLPEDKKITGKGGNA